jgi:hypothetical protein
MKGGYGKYEMGARGREGKEGDPRSRSEIGERWDKIGDRHRASHGNKRERAHALGGGDSSSQSNDLHTHNIPTTWLLHISSNTKNILTTVQGGTVPYKPSERSLTR